jgi:hypothetical protein
MPLAQVRRLGWSPYETQRRNRLGHGPMSQIPVQVSASASSAVPLNRDESGDGPM